jgi:hypothetical protein
MATVKLKYVGPFDEIAVPLGDDQWITCKRNHQAEFPAELAGNKDGGLLAQADNWERADKGKKEGGEG